MGIPHIIHFIWVGGNKYSELAEKCIVSWKRFCPDYEIVRWDESNFDINSNKFVKQAYEAKKWAFVSDYIRLYALYHHGGVYMDADMELIKNIDEIVDVNDAFTGYQVDTIPSGIMGASKFNPWIKELLGYYDDRHFIMDDGGHYDKTNSEIITEISKDKFDFALGDDIIKVGNVRLYPEIYFSPYKKNMFVKKLDRLHSAYLIDETKTLGIHHFAGSWDDNSTNKGHQFVKALARLIFPQNLYQGLQKKLVDTNGKLKSF